MHSLRGCIRLYNINYGRFLCSFYQQQSYAKVCCVLNVLKGESQTTQRMNRHRNNYVKRKFDKIHLSSTGVGKPRPESHMQPVKLFKPAHKALKPTLQISSENNHLSLSKLWVLWLQKMNATTVSTKINTSRECKVQCGP